MVALPVPPDGRFTSQNVLTLPLGGGEVMLIVSPGNAAQGNTYQTTTAYLAAFFSAFPSLNSEIIKAGATSISPYAVAATDTRILFNKTIGAASYAVVPLSESMAYSQPVFFKDLKGDADVNPITVTFSGGQLCETFSQRQITIPYGWFTIFPIPGGSGWYMGS